MTITTITLLALTGTLVLFKLGLMALAVVLLTKTLIPSSKPFALRSALTSLSLRCKSLICARKLDE